ncbi:hypothetical protein D3C76_1366220 [compost metagenome]
MDFAAGLDELAGADPGVLITGDSEVVIRPQLGFPIRMNGAVFLGLEFAVGVGLHGIVAFVPDPDMLVVLDVFIPVALGMNEYLFLAFPVLDAQLVEAVTAGIAVGLEQAAGLVFR